MRWVQLCGSLSILSLSCVWPFAAPWTVGNPPGSSVYRIHQARVVEYVVIPFSRESSQPRDRTWVSCIAGRFFTIWATREAQWIKISGEQWVVAVKQLKDVVIGNWPQNRRIKPHPLPAPHPKEKYMFQNHFALWNFKCVLLIPRVSTLLLLY